MTDKKITQLTELTSASATDILPIVDDVAGSPVTKKIAVSNLVTDTNLTLTDITTGNSSTTKHGFLPKLNNVHTTFMDGTGAWDTIKDADISFADSTTNNASTASHGFLPKLTGDVATFLAGDGTYQLIEKADGWTNSEDTWVYVSASSFKVTGKNVTSMFRKGTKIKLVQSSIWKYFYVVSSSFSTDTTITITGGSDYTLANSTISSPRYSYAENPQTFPQWFNWTPTLTGYSANPTDTVYRFNISGGNVYVSIREVTNGTSNGAGISITLPVTAATISNQIWMYPAAFVNAGTISTTWGRGVIASADNKVVFGINPAVQDGFTSTGGKRISSFEGWYEF